VRSGGGDRGGVATQHGGGDPEDLAPGGAVQRDRVRHGVPGDGDDVPEVL